MLKSCQHTADLSEKTSATDPAHFTWVSRALTWSTIVVQHVHSDLMQQSAGLVIPESLKVEREAETLDPRHLSRTSFQLGFVRQTPPLRFRINTFLTLP